MRPVLLVVVSVIMLGGVGYAGESCHAPKAVPDAPQMALFRVPGLTKDLATNIVMTLADEPGVMAARPNLSESTLAVTFDGRKTTAEKVLEAITSVAAEATLEKVEPAPAMGRGPCAGCPSRKGCARAKE